MKKGDYVSLTILKGPNKGTEVKGRVERVTIYQAYVRHPAVGFMGLQVARWFPVERLHVLTNSESVAQE